MRAKATDNAGNAETASSRTFTFDATAPTGSLTAPADSAVVSGSSVTVSSDSADAVSGVALATFERRPSGGGSWTTIDTDSAAPYSVSWDTTAVGDGDYDLRVTTDDRSGNTFTSATRTVTVDNTAPLSATLERSPGAIRNGQDLTGSGRDAGSGVASLSYYYCAGPPCSPSTSSASSPTGPSYSVTWNSQPADGGYQVLARVTDRAGHTLDSTKQTVTVDNTNPTGSLTAPADGAQVSGTVAVSSDSADAGSGVAERGLPAAPERRRPWTTIANDTTAPYSTNWDTTPLGDGDYDLRVVTTDVAGNSFTSFDSHRQRRQPRADGLHHRARRVREWRSGRSVHRHGLEPGHRHRRRRVLRLLECEHQLLERLVELARRPGHDRSVHGFVGRPG